MRNLRRFLCVFLFVFYSSSPNSSHHLDKRVCIGEKGDQISERAERVNHTHGIYVL